MIKVILYFGLYLFSVIIFVPAVVTFIYNGTEIFSSDENTPKNEQEIINNLEFSAEESEKIVVTNNKFEDYIVGVVAAEMPISFEEEALKAQAIAARTYAFKRIEDINSEVDYKNIGQAYDTLEDMKQKWGGNFEEYHSKVENAVYSTKGLIMLYEEEPIEAVFHSTSAGTTEVSENIWGRNLPYIQSVDSTVDENAPNFIYTTTVPNEEIIQKLLSGYEAMDKEQIISSFEIGQRSEAGYVMDVLVCGQKISARDIRTLFSLRSTNFTIQKNPDSISFTTKGYGHGAGMSQYGANFMAQGGSTYIDILNHYYKGITIQKAYDT